MILFKSIPYRQILKNRDTVYKHTLVLFKDLYKTIKSDLYVNNYNIDFSPYQDDIKYILKIAYRKLYSKNIKMTSNITKKNTKSQNKISMQSQQKTTLDKDIYNTINLLIEKETKERSKLLIEGVENAIVNIKNKTQKEFDNIINQINLEIHTINNEIMDFYTMVASDRLNIEYNRLIDKRDKFIKDRDTLIKKREEHTQGMFNRMFDDEIVQNKSELHAMNEIDNFDTLQQKEESNIIDKFFQFTLFIDEDDNKYRYSEGTKTWLNPLDRESRGWHANEHGKTIKENEHFELVDNQGNVERCLYPRDSNLSAYNSIGCRCSLERNKEFQLI